MIEKFKDFNIINLMCERLHVNNDIDTYSDIIYPIISNSKEVRFEFTDLPVTLNISKLVINIKDMKPGLSGELDLNKCKKTNKGWIIHINLKIGFYLYSLKHELNHALRLTLVGKDKMIKNLNHIKAQNIFGSFDKDLDYFFYLMYLANDEEINAKVIETSGLIKEIVGNNKLKTDEFYSIIRDSDAYRNSNLLIDFSCDVVFKKWDENKLNKLFYILEENKSALDRIQDSKFTKIKLIIKYFRDSIKNTTRFDIVDMNVYNPKVGKKFYDKWIPSQGEKLKRRLLSLQDHYN